MILRLLKEYKSAHISLFLKAADYHPIKIIEPLYDKTNEMTSRQAFSFLSDPGYYVFFFFHICVFVAIKIKFKPKPTKSTMGQSNTRIRLGGSESSLCAQWVVNDLS